MLVIGGGAGGVFTPPPPLPLPSAVCALDVVVLVPSEVFGGSAVAEGGAMLAVAGVVAVEVEVEVVLVVAVEAVVVFVVVLVVEVEIEVVDSTVHSLLRVLFAEILR